MIAAQIAPNVVQALNSDFYALAKTYGALERHPETRSSLQNGLIEAFSAKARTLI